MSSSQAADTFNGQRSRPSSPAPRTPNGTSSRPKSSLEERLRAKLASRESVNKVKPPNDVSTPLVSAQDHPLSPQPTQSHFTPSQEHEPLSPTSTPPVVQDDCESVVDVDNSASKLQTGDVAVVQNSPHLPGEVIDDQPSDAPPLVETPPLPESNSPNNDVNALQERLKLVEQRFADISTSFKTLQAEKALADSIIRELTPVESIRDADRLREYLNNISLKNEISQDEIKRLNGKLTRQEERIEELRDTHRLESKSQSDQIDNLRRQIAETQAITRDSISQMESDSAKRLKEIDQLQAEAERARNVAKEEEEKRVKAISMLKTVRQKLVKAEKEKEDALKELTALREKDIGAQEKINAELLRLQQEIDALNAEREKTIIGLKAQFDRELGIVRDQSLREISALRNQFELEDMSAKEAHSSELAAKNSVISTLESSRNSLINEKNALFSQLQSRQAEHELLNSHLDSLQSQNVEMQYRLRESKDRLISINQELIEARQDQANLTSDAMTSPEEVARLLSAMEGRYESKIADLQRDINHAERERDSGEAEWNRKFNEKARELENLRRALEISSKSKQKNDEADIALKEEIQQLKEQLRLNLNQISALQAQCDKAKDAENAGEALVHEFREQIYTLERQIEESKSRESQLRLEQRTLRDEIRKVQASASLLEQQRVTGSPAVSARTGSPALGSPSQSKDEDVNIEYLRNVVLQFLEHPDMRPSLVRVLSIILRFTPQETRRLVAKV